MLKILVNFKCLKIPADYRKPFYFALVLHLLLLITLTIHFNFTHAVQGEAVQAQIIEASTVSEHQLQEYTHQQEQQKRAAQRAVLQHQQQLARAQAAKLAAQKQAPLALEKTAQAKAATKATAEKQAQQKAEQAKTLAAEQAAAKKQEEAAAKQKALDAAHQEQVAGEVSHYQSLLLNAIAAHWIIPPDADKKASCELLVNLDASGQVLSVKLLKSSGNVALDQSAETAVLQASPLPVPDDKDAFAEFQDLHLTMRPEDVLG